MWRSLVSRLNGVQEAAGSNPVTRTTSEQAVYRLLRLFLKVRARSRRCSSFPTATRCAGLAVGRPPCGRHFSPLKCRFYPSLPKRLEIARFQAFFTLSWQNGIVKLSKSAQESAQTLKIGALSFTNTREMGNGYHLGGAVPEIFIDNFTARWYSTREKTAMTEKSPQLSVQREARQVKGLYGRRRAVPLPSGPG